MSLTATCSPGRIFLGRYQYVRPLGEGGMGQVLLGRRIPDGQPVVIKLMRPELAADPLAQRNFEHETTLLARFRHPNAVALHDADLLGNPPCLILEYVPGVSLDTLLHRQRRFEPHRAGHILSQICDVLQAAHDAGILHRDLSAANVMLIEAGSPLERVKVMDFGLARPSAAAGPYIALERLTGDGISLGGGTPDYVCPEQLRGEPVDHRGDIYSAGVLLYLMLTGRLPFQNAHDTADILRSHLEQLPPAFAAIGVCDLGKNLEALVRCCLNKYANERPQSAREVAELYAQALGEPPHPQAESAPAPSPAPQPQGRPRIDPRYLIDTVEAWMPEQIAAVKLRGFVHDLGGEVIESVPNLIRVRLPFTPASPDEPEQPRGWLSMFGSGKQHERKSVSLALVELYLEKVPDVRQSRLQISVVMRHGGDVKLISSPQWKPWCERVCRDLRAYLISR